ncbi:type II toxin-antitoxin system RelE/ParE family toxin [Compostibacter hankyongensis]|uniref:Type II toxin-antitoxin system RelE/ParE family toxin n=1 Tax=Compostibacter hankyongensis TaxID=1007089 RepID=A0ABP8FGA5_9BACT
MPDPYAISIRTAAELDIKEAVEWYREKAPLQVAPLIQALSERFDLICRNPFLFQIDTGTSELLSCDSSPMVFSYIIEEKRVVVLAVLHTKRLF